MPIGCRKERRPIGGRCAVRRPGPALLICIWARSLPAANQAAPKPRRPSHSFRFSCSLLCSLSATAGAPAVGGASAAGPRRQLPQSQQRRQRGIAFQPHRQRRAHREVTPETRGPPASPEGSTGPLDRTTGLTQSWSSSATPFTLHHSIDEPSLTLRVVDSYLPSAPSFSYFCWTGKQWPVYF